MADTITPTRRSENMRRIRAKDTSPEMVVRRLLHSLGYRYRLHAKDLPGKPDVVFRSKKQAIFIHGCFWHQHRECRAGRLPASRPEYWIPKLGRNVERDRNHEAELIKIGWRVLTIWECQLHDRAKTELLLSEFLTSARD